MISPLARWFRMRSRPTESDRPQQRRDRVPLPVLPWPRRQISHPRESTRVLIPAKPSANLNRGPAFFPWRFVRSYREADVSKTSNG